MSKKRLINKELRRLGIFIAVLAIVIVPILVYQSYGNVGVELLSIIIGSLLTLTLVVLYFQQYSILKKQTELRHREYRSSLSKAGTIVADDDNISIKLKNKGRGKVTRMFIKSEIISETGDIDVGFGRTSLKNVETDSTELEPNSDFQEFEARATFRILSSDDPDRGYPFKYITNRLSLQNITSCTLRLTLEVVDEGLIEGNFSHEKKLAEQELEIKGSKTVTRIENGEEIQKELPQATSIEDALETDYASRNDINKTRWEEAL